MKNIIEVIERAIENEKWSVNYHMAQFEAARKKRDELELELAELKVKLSEPKPEQVNKIRPPFPNVDPERFLNQKG